MKSREILGEIIGLFISGVLLSILAYVLAYRFGVNIETVLYSSANQPEAPSFSFHLGKMLCIVFTVFVIIIFTKFCNAIAKRLYHFAIGEK